jgi:replicative DNA helicase
MNNPYATPPYTQEGEEAVLGAVLLNPDVYLNVAAFLRPEDFFLQRHIAIWAAIQHVHERDNSIDLLTVQEELRITGELQMIGGSAYLTQLINNAPTSVNAEVYGRLVERAALRRRLIVAADQIRALAVDETQETDVVTAQAEKTLFAVTERNLRRDVLTLREAITTYYERMEYLMQHPDEPLGVPTGFRDLDAMLGGLQKSDLLIFAGRPGMGKTSFLLSVALHAAKRNVRIAIFTMEMGAEQIVQRLIAMETGINTQKLRTSGLDDHEWMLFVEATGNMSGLQVFIDDTPAMTPLQMRTKCRRLQHEFGLDLVIVDYIQLMNGGGNFENNRVQEISYISRNMKELARELDVPVFSAAQLSRAVEQRQDKRPLLSDLRESGSIEQDADIVMFLYRDVVYNEATEFPNQADVIVAKHRNGPTGTISLHFERSQTKFTDAHRETVNLSSV